MKYLVVILSAILVITQVGGNIIDNKLSNLNLEKTNYLISINQTLLDSHDKGFHVIGLQIDALGLLIEKKGGEYYSKVDQARKSKTLFDSLYQKAASDLNKLREKEGKIHRVAFWHSLLKTWSEPLLLDRLG